MSECKLETFDNAYPDRDYKITIHIEYIPNQKCIELKSLKYYLFGFRNEGIFYEMVINKILDDLVEACQPRWMEVKGNFNIRGGIDTIVTATFSYQK